MRLALTFFFIAATVTAFGQPISQSNGNVTYRNDTVYSHGKPYCLLKEFKMNDGVDLSMRNLSNDELAYIRYDKFSSAEPAVYRFNFKQSGNEVKVNTNDKNAVASMIVNAELVKDGAAIDAQREEAFVVNNGGTPKKQEVFDSKFRLVSRDKSMPIVVLGDDITQETQKIGNLKEGGQYINKVFMKQLSVFLPNGQKVAEATYAENNATSARVLTVKDGKDQEVTINPGSKPRKQVLDWLVRNGYL
jgi:hypothetical protein